MDFARVEAEFERLKDQFEQGGLTEDEFKAQLQELMIEDEQGRWWILGYETGQWYVHDGEQWVQQEPPGATPSAAPARPRYPGAAELAPDSQPGSTSAAPSRILMGLKLGRDTVSVLLITAGWLVCLGAYVALGGGYPGITSGAVLGGIGGLITGLVLRRTDPPSPWKQVPLVTVGWAIGMATLPVPELYRFSWMIRGMILGLVGGLATALALKWTQPSIRWKHVIIITLGWVIGWAVGGTISFSFFPRIYPSTFVISLVNALWGGIGGGAGSWVMFWQLREARQSTP